MRNNHQAKQEVSKHDYGDHHAEMVADFRFRFWVNLVVTLSVLTLSPMLQQFVGLDEALRFLGGLFVLLGLSSAVFFYGWWPFPKGLFDELTDANPGMMSLIAWRSPRLTPTAPPSERF